MRAVYAAVFDHDRPPAGPRRSRTKAARHSAVKKAGKRPRIGRNAIAGQISGGAREDSDVVGGLSGILTSSHGASLLPISVSSGRRYWMDGRKGAPADGAACFAYA